MLLIKIFVRLSSDVFQTFSFIFQRFVRPFSDDLSPLPDVAAPAASNAGHAHLLPKQSTSVSYPAFCLCSKNWDH